MQELRIQTAFTDPVSMESAFFIRSLVGVSTKVIPLSLQQVGWQTSLSISVIVAQSGSEAGDRKSEFHGSRDRASPAGLSFFDGIAEEVVQQQVFQLWIFVKCRFDVLQEGGSDDTATSPQQGDISIIQIPAKVFGGGVQLDVTLCIAA